MSVITQAQMDGLPAPLVRYLVWAGVLGRPPIRAVRLWQSGTFTMNGRAMPFTAEQSVTTDPPGFEWRARIRMFPLVTAAVLDAYRDGHGLLEARLFRIFRMAHSEGPDTDRGELLRYLPECAWYPTAFLDRGFAWEPIDDSRVRATLTVGAVAVEATLEFDQEGRLCRGSARRPMLGKDGRTTEEEWSGEFSQYKNMGGYHIPAGARVCWHLEAGELEYFRSEITRIEYET